MPLFENPPIGSFVTSDIDTFMDYFLMPDEEVPDGIKSGITIEHVRVRHHRIEQRLNLTITAFYRRSSNGHIHVRLMFPCEITVLDAFLLRSCLYDDMTRFQLDHARYLLTGSLHEMNRTFDEKYNAADGQVRRAGPWIPLDIGRDDLKGDALKDFMMFDFEEAHKKSQKNGTEKKIEKDDNQRVLGFV